MCLFVNIGDKYGKCYDNNFLNDGIEMTWFGQSAHSFDKPIMQRIMKIRSPADADSIHLFCRYEGEAYIYCGSAVPCCPCIDLCFCPPYRLRVRLRARAQPLRTALARRLMCKEVFAQQRPLKFLMELVDAPTLLRSENFLSLLELAEA